MSTFTLRKCIVRWMNRVQETARDLCSSSLQSLLGHSYFYWLCPSVACSTQQLTGSLTGCCASCWAGARPWHRLRTYLLDNCPGLCDLPPQCDVLEITEEMCDWACMFFQLEASNLYWQWIRTKQLNSSILYMLEVHKSKAELRIQVESDR